MSLAFKTPTPCDKLVEPFFSCGYCVACGWLAQLHTTEGWHKYYADQAHNCKIALEGHERRVAELRVAVATAEATATHPPTWSPFDDTGYTGYVPRERKQ